MELFEDETLAGEKGLNVVFLKDEYGEPGYTLAIQYQSSDQNVLNDLTSITITFPRDTKINTPVRTLVIYNTEPTLDRIQKELERGGSIVKQLDQDIEELFERAYEALEAHGYDDLSIALGKIGHYFNKGRHLAVTNVCDPEFVLTIKR